MIAPSLCECPQSHFGMEGVYDTIKVTMKTLVVLIS